MYQTYTLDIDLDKLYSESIKVPDLVTRREHVSNKNGGVQIHDVMWEHIIPNSYIETQFKPKLLRFLTKTLSKNKMIFNIWLNLNYPLSYNALHNHDGKYSGVFYVNIPEGSGNLIFPKLEETIVPEPGMIVLMKSDLQHAVEPNLSDDIRISFAFNCDW